MAANLLNKYRKMRDFGETPEPSGGKPKQGKLPIFVIQKHHASHLHYDFRLEMEGVLKSWAIPKGPSYDPAVKRLAMMTEDHPYDYAGFEGVIPANNYGAGNVIIWDEGTWELIEPESNPVAGIRAGKLAFRLYGHKMFGEWALVKIHGRGSSDRGNEWLLLKHRDEYANEKVDVTEVAALSVVSGRDVEELGGGDRQWKSNRAGGGVATPTIASKLAAGKSKKQGRASGAKAKTVAGKRPGAESRPAAARKAAGSKRKSASSPAKKARKASTKNGAAKRAARPVAKPASKRTSGRGKSRAISSRKR